MSQDTDDIRNTPATEPEKPQSQWRPWHVIVLIALAIATVIIIIRHNQNPKAEFIQEEGAIFGTFFHVTYEAPKSLMPDIMAELKSVDASLSMFNPNSTISHINDNSDMHCDSMLCYVITLSQQVSKATDGAFDITVAPLVNAWGFGFKNGALPDSATVDSLLRYVGYDRITLNDDATLTKADPAIVLDCSAVAKGFGADRVAGVLASHGCTNFMVEIGGEIVCRGHNPKGELWKVGVNKPVDDVTSTSNALEAVLPLTDRAMATSGNYRNFYITDDGRRVSHTIDPKTGFPAQHSLLSATVMAPTCAEADAFATAFMVMGLDRAKALLPTLPQLQVYLIYDHEGEDAIYTNIRERP